MTVLFALVGEGAGALVNVDTSLVVGIKYVTRTANTLVRSWSINATTISWITNGSVGTLVDVWLGVSRKFDSVGHTFTALAISLQEVTTVAVALVATN